MNLPSLATCSYAHYQRQMGTAVRISRSALRGVALPSPRYTDHPKWPVIPALVPEAAIRQLKGLEFARRYLSQLEATPMPTLLKQMRAIPQDDGHRTLVLLCFEKDPAVDPCHRRHFADWWQRVHGERVPELEPK